MTNLANGNLGWEVAGGKKTSTKKVTTNGTDAAVKTNGKNGTAAANNMPKLETLPPLKPSSTIYDVIRESDDDDLDVKNNNTLKSSARIKEQQARKIENLGSSSSTSQSPKQRKQQPQSEPINLLASNIVSNQKKKANSPQPTKNTQSELEKALSELKVEDFEREHTYLISLFSSNSLLINEHLVNFLNNKLNHVAELELSVYTDKELGFPLSKLEKKVAKFISAQITKLNRQEQEKLFEFSFVELFNESSKINSFHGFKLYLQMLAKQVPGVLLNNLNKFEKILNENKHRHQRCLIALWALGQGGNSNAFNAITIWFESMLPFISTKNCTTYVASYLQNIFDHHKVSRDQTQSSTQANNKNLISLDQYVSFYDLVNEKTSLNLAKDVAQKLKSAFQYVRSLFVQQLANNGSNYLEQLFQQITVTGEKSAKQTDFVELASVALLNNSESLVKWRQISSRYLPQTILLLEELYQNQNKRFRALKDLNKTLAHFEEQTAVQIAKLSPSSSSSASKDSAAKHHFRNNKGQKASSSELDNNRKLNALSKTLLKQYFQRTSLLAMSLRTIILLIAAVGVFFYWDINQNKSVYTKTVSKELERYGLLEPVLHLIESVRQFTIKVTKLVNHYVPIWYKQVKKTVGPLAQTGWEKTQEYAQLAWTKSEPGRKAAQDYLNQAQVYLEKNFPVFIENLTNYSKLAIQYAATLYQLAVEYLHLGLDYVGVQLLGLKKDDLQRIFLDAFKLAIEYISQLIQRITAALNNM